MQWLVMAGSWAMTTRGAQLEWGTDCLEFKEPRGQAIGRIIYIVTEMVKKKDQSRQPAKTFRLHRNSHKWVMP